MVAHPLVVDACSLLQSPPQEISFPNGLSPAPDFDKQMFNSMMTARLQHAFCCKSWDKISTQRGLYLTTDQIHINDRCGAMLIDLIIPWLENMVFATTQPL